MERINIFVSSTCYDLAQIRLDISTTISKLGYNPILSESKNFPMNPALSTHENCIEVVEKFADIFVLIIGNRYGHILENGKSITNVELKTAQHKGIPIYVFISKPILNILPIYKANPNSDYSQTVDNVQIFEFVNEIREPSNLWCFEFENADDIAQILTAQFAYLFKETLRVRSRLDINLENLLIKNLSAKSLKIILEKDDHFEYEFLAQVLIDEISNFNTLKNDFDYKIIVRPKGKITDDHEFILWIQNRIACLKQFISSLEILFNPILPVYIKNEGTPSDLNGLHYAAHTFARIYEGILTWSIETLSISVDDNQVKLQNLLSAITKDMVDEIYQYPMNLYVAIKEAKDRLKRGEDVVEVKLILSVNLNPDLMSELNCELESLLYSAYSQS